MADETTKKIHTDKTVRPGTDADTKGRDSNPDAITGAPGSHPVGTGIGAAVGGAAAGVGTAAAVGAATGAAAGSVVPGPGTVVGGVVGAVVGAVAGGYAGKAVAEKIDPTVEDAYWRGEYRNRKYYDSSMDYESDFSPAYRYGWESYSVYGNRPMNEVDDDLRSGWDKSRGKSRLEWDRAQHAVRDAWDRLKDRTSSGTGTGATGSSTGDYRK